MANTAQFPHLIIIPSPGISHTTPLVELTKLLVLRHHFTATIITFSSSSLPSPLPPSISTIQLPLADLPIDTDTVTRIILTITQSLSPLRQILLSLKRTTRHLALFFDFFGLVFLPLAQELAIPTYLFIPSNLFYVSFVLHLPALVETATVQKFQDLMEPLELPGCVPLKGEDFTDPVEERESEATAWMVHDARLYDHVEGILVNSFEALEADAAKFLRKRGNGKPPVWPIGPLTGSRLYENCEEPSHKCIEWLNQQPSESVVFICFGSGGTLSWEQTCELALGLEMSGQRFLWVVRAGSDTGLGASFLNPNQSNDDPTQYLPEGFVERIPMDKGMMVMSWAPQRDILSHRSTGGFVSHCGWNSTLESLVNGVPMVAWPLHSEQRMNAVLLAEGAKVALRVREENGMVRREEVAMVVKKLMVEEEGKEMRHRMQELKKEAERATEKEGSSFKALDELVIWPYDKKNERKDRNHTLVLQEGNHQPST